MTIDKSGYIWICGGLFFVVSLFAIGKVFFFSYLLGLGFRFAVWLFQLQDRGLLTAEDRRLMSKITDEDGSVMVRRTVLEVTQSCFLWGVVLSYPFMFAYLLFNTR